MERTSWGHPLTLRTSNGVSPNFGVTGTLPVGLQLNASTGLLSGTPTDGATFPITILSWVAPATISFGAAMGNLLLNAVWNLAGVFVCTPPGDDHVLTASFRPDAPTAVNGGTITAAINVNPLPWVKVSSNNAIRSIRWSLSTKCNFRVTAYMMDTL